VPQRSTRTKLLEVRATLIENYGKAPTWAERTDTLLALAVRASAASATPPACRQTSFPVANGGFESGSFAPWIVNGEGASVVAGGSYGSGFAARLDYDGDSVNAPLVTQPFVPVCPASNYSIGVDYRSPFTTPTCTFSLGFGVETPTYVYVPLDETDWTHYTFDAPSYAEAYAMIFTGIDCEHSGDEPNATVFLDNFTV
jgi:hypothetical protein